jgi:L-iditol 2-dehydrogenase
MKSLLLTQYNHLEITDTPKPESSPDEVLIQVAACGICGSDVHGFDGSTGRRIPPLVMGHEAAGLIAALGVNVKNFKIGERVTFDSTVFCGACANCKRGDINLCDNRQVLGVSCGDYRRSGAFAEYVVVPARIVHRLPDNLPFAEAAMLEATAVALHAVRITPLEPTSTTLVVGAGMIGLLILQSLRATGTQKVFVADVDDSRLKMAKDLGATEVLNSKTNLAAQVLKLTNNNGVDVVLEAVGRTETIADSIDSVRKGGTVTLVGNFAPEVKIHLQKVVSRQIRLQGSCASSGEYPQAIEFLSSGVINVKPLITQVVPLEDGPAWFDRLHTGEAGLLKVVLTPGKTA